MDFPCGIEIENRCMYLAESKNVACYGINKENKDRTSNESLV